MGYTYSVTPGTRKNFTFHKNLHMAVFFNIYFYIKKILLLLLCICNFIHAMFSSHFTYPSTSKEPFDYPKKAKLQISSGINFSKE